MFNTLYVLAYNNYYNRTIKVEESTGVYAEYDSIVLPNVNFNPNDGVDTTIILNVDEYATPDYIVVADENDNIVSRWFIIDRKRVRAGQSTFLLHRDVIADYYNIIKTSPVFVEKATLSYMNPLIFNSESMTFNQIKTNEYLLKDKSNCAWLVGYYSKNTAALQGTVSLNKSIDLPFKTLDTPITSWPLYQYLNTNLKVNLDNPFSYIINAADKGLIPASYRFLINNTTGEVTKEIEDEFVNNALRFAAVKYAREGIQSGLNTIGGVSYLNELAPGSMMNIKNKSVLEELASYAGYVRDSDGAVFKLTVSPGVQSKETIYVEKNSALFLTMNNIIKNSRDSLNNIAFSGEANAYSFAIEIDIENYSIGLTEIPDYETTYNITPALSTADAPYNIFAIPYGEINIMDAANNLLVKTNAEISMTVATSIQKQEQSEVFDIQLLPYCPVQGLITDVGELSITNSKQYSLITSQGTNVGIVFNVPYSQFSFDIFKTVSCAGSALERKVNSECDKWRLASPNYSNYFDFSVEKNNGIEFFNVDCNYKPYSPYIHINPNFRGLYGNDFNDPRGLVCGGDFSISQIVDNWEQYQIQNKNFQEIFDRQIQNMDFTNRVAQTTDIISAIAGTAQGGVSGATAGAMSGAGVWGAVAGGIAGSAISGMAGAADVEINRQLRSEARDMAIDQFGYQLGNIQALPQTISKVSALNANNKIFPVLEYYTATDVEKAALRNKVKYNGMTTMVIGTLEEYQQIEPTYIKGRLIRCDLAEDTHIIQSIANELYQGVYI